jgi:hypothetical protein
MKERRKHDRFTYHLPVRIRVVDSDNEKVLDLVTKDMSTSGIYEILSNVVYGIRQRSGLLQRRQQILLL